MTTSRSSETDALLDLVHLVRENGPRQSVRDLSNRWKWSRRSVDRWFERLEAAGLIGVERCDGGTNVFLLCATCGATWQAANNGFREIVAPLRNIYTLNISNKEGVNGMARAQTHRSRFEPPTVEEVERYAAGLGYEKFDASHFWHHHNSAGWTLRGGRKMRCWKSAVVTWQKNGERFGNSNSSKGMIEL